MHGVEYGRWTGELMWAGVTTQKNGLGRLCFISAFFLLWTFVARWQCCEIRTGKSQTYAEGLLLLMIAVLLKGPSTSAASATSITTLGVGTITLGGLVWLKRKGRVVSANALMTAVAFIIGVGILTPAMGGATVGAFTGALGRDTTLTGRTDIWAGLLPVAMQHPFWGAGFGGFWTPETIEIHRVNEAHSGYLGVFLETGVVGLVLQSVFLLSCCRKAHAALPLDFDSASLCLCFLFMAVLHNISEASMNVFATHLTATVVFLTLSLSAAAVPEPGYVPNPDTEHKGMSQNLTGSCSGEPSLVSHL